MPLAQKCSAFMDGCGSLVQRYPAVQAGISIFGHATFFVGSVFFLWDSTVIPGTWLFVVGAFGMMLGHIGDALTRRMKGEI